MNGVHHNDNIHDFEKMYPGCLGRMGNLFEPNIGASANSLLNDKPHQGGSLLLRSRSDVSGMSTSGDPIELKEIVSGSNNIFTNIKSNGTPMKMLIAQEMSAEVVSGRDPPNLVAKLMGIDALPHREPGSTTQRSHSRVHPRSNLDIPMNYPEQQNGSFPYMNPNESNGRYEEAENDRKMNLVRQKFNEAKRLSMDEKLRQSNRFHDAVDVLSSNKDLFLKYLQEPNSMYSQQLHGLHSIQPPPETKRITVLRPSKVANSNDFAGARYRDEKQIKRGTFVRPNKLEKIHPQSSPAAGLKYDENSTQPTRIVVLKPSPGELHNVEGVGSSKSDMPKIFMSEEFFGDAEDNECQESRKVAKSITQQVRVELGEHHRNETLFSSVFSSNGYVGDESSSNKSEIECPDVNLSDSEIMLSVSRHSGEYADRLGSPYSSSSFTRVSCSPESSVCREAKKRLSERWAIMASNRSYQEQRHFQRNPRTLGDMLALSETKKETSHRGKGSFFEEPRKSDALMVSEWRREENMDYSPRNLIRSKSVPVSSAEFGTRLNVDISVSDKRKSESTKKETKERSVKSLFRGKVSSLFFSRNKKPGKTKSLVSENKDANYLFPGETCSNNTESLSENGLGCTSPGPLKPNPISKQGAMSLEIGSAFTEPIACGKTGENHDQISPISVLDPPFEENRPHDQHGHAIETPVNFIGSNLIDKSPPIGSIARTLSRDNSSLAASSSHPTNVTTQKIDEEQECYFLVKTLLSVAGLRGEVRPNSFLGRWHSPESPLDPSLRDSYVDDLNDALRVAKQRQNRYVQKLVFDCVNEVLVDISGYESDPRQRAFGTDKCILDEAWAQMKVWFSREDKCALGNKEVVVEKMVSKEVLGKGWNRNFGLETDSLGKEIGGELLDELVKETVVELTGRV
ncbi:hypothetical protein OROMI_015987 [Orobanche minor]